MFCRPRSEHREAHQQVHSGVEHRGQRRRQRDHRRQRARHPRAAVGREVLLRDRSKTRLEDRLPKFAHIVFHEKLGTQAERIARIAALAGHLAPIVGADVAKAERAAQLCKADLLDRSGRRISRAAGLDGPILRAKRRARTKRSRMPARITTAQKGRTISCRPIRYRSRSRLPTRSTS